MKMMRMIPALVLAALLCSVAIAADTDLAPAPGDYVESTANLTDLNFDTSLDATPAPVSGSDSFLSDRSAFYLIPATGMAAIDMTTNPDPARPARYERMPGEGHVAVPIQTVSVRSPDVYFRSLRI